MSSHSMPAVTLGLDVVSEERMLPNGAVRQAENVTLLNNGGFRRRPGHAPLISLRDAHSLWISPAQTRAYVAAGDTLYEVDLAAQAVAVLYVGLPIEQPVSYTDVGPDVFLTCGGLLLKVTPSGSVRSPGVADLNANAPTLSATGGGLFPGRYGVAFSLVNDLGDESGISKIEWIDLPDGGGITISGMSTAPNVVKTVIWATGADGGELYHYQTIAQSSIAEVVDRARKRHATRQYLQPMPGGEIVRLYNGRLYVARGKWIYFSEPLDHNVSSVKSGWLTFNRTVNVMEPVQAGIFVGLRERSMFLRGDEPDKFQQIELSSHGALPNSGTDVAPDFFSSSTVKDRDNPVAAWLSEAGIAIGRADGSVVYPQEGRITVDGGVSKPAFFRLGGVKQCSFSVEGMALGLEPVVDQTI